MMKSLFLGAALIAASFAAQAQTGWTLEKLNKAMKDSERPVEFTQKTFDEIQARRTVALKRTEKYLDQRFGKADPAVLKAFAEVPREYYHYHHADRRSFVKDAYDPEAKPWAVGYGSALSDYLGQAYMTQAAKVTPDMTVLEIGTGSGYQSSVLGRMAKKVYSIEIIEPLGKSVAKMYKPLGYDSNITTKVGDGFFGWPKLKAALM